MTADRLAQQIQFILELDKLKTVLRRSYITSGERRENSAEHSWHLATMAILLSEYANQPVDLLKVLKMLLIHDIVEIDAGDTYCYDTRGNNDKPEREKLAAERLFGILPEDQGKELRELWEEFEAQDSAESKFAAVLDRLMPLLHNYHTQGRSWMEHGITRDQVMERNMHIGQGSEVLWDYIRERIDDAVQKGFLLTHPGGQK